MALVGLSTERRALRQSLPFTGRPEVRLGSCAGRALVVRARQVGELARPEGVLRQRRPPAAPSLLAARDMSRGVPPAVP